MKRGQKANKQPGCCRPCLQRWLQKRALVCTKPTDTLQVRMEFSSSKITSWDLTPRAEAEIRDLTQSTGQQALVYIS